MAPLRVGIVGTGIFATDNHLPTLQKFPELYKPVACYNRTKAKAETFATKAGIPAEKVHDSLESIFADDDVDVIDALLPVQYNLDVIKLALKYNKPICFEKPIAANLDQAEEIVKLSKASKLPIFVLEQFAYFNCVELMKTKAAQIGNVLSFTYRSTGPFKADNKYLATGWRLKPEHIGGYLSDGGVHQLAQLTGVLGKVEKISAYTKQVREVSGTDDILYSTMKLESGVIGTFTYGSVFGATDKFCIFEIMGDSGSVKYDFSPGKTPTITTKIGDGSAPAKVETIEVENGYPLDAEFEVFAEAVNKNDLSIIKTTPEICYHHLAIIVAAMKSSAKDGENVVVEQP